LDVAREWKKPARLVSGNIFRNGLKGAREFLNIK